MSIGCRRPTRAARRPSSATPRRRSSSTTEARSAITTGNTYSYQLIAVRLSTADSPSTGSNVASAKASGVDVAARDHSTSAISTAASVVAENSTIAPIIFTVDDAGNADHPVRPKLLQLQCDGDLRRAGRPLLSDHTTVLTTWRSTPPARAVTVNTAVAGRSRCRAAAQPDLAQTAMGYGGDRPRPLGAGPTAAPTRARAIRTGEPSARARATRCSDLQERAQSVDARCDRRGRDHLQRRRADRRCQPERSEPGRFHPGRRSLPEPTAPAALGNGQLYQTVTKS